MTPLQKSIEHWERLRDTTDWENITERPNVKGCALCKIYYTNECAGCPIFIVTKEILCDGTPYHDASRLFKDCEDAPTPMNRLNWAHAAQQMINFLEGLPLITTE